MNEMIGYDESGSRTQVTMPSSWEEQMDAVAGLLHIEAIPQTTMVNGTLGAISLDGFPDRLTGGMSRWVRNRVGMPKIQMVGGKRYQTMESSSASKRVVRKVKDDWAELENPDEEDLMALVAFHLNTERFNLKLRREFALEKNACLATKDLPQGNLKDEGGRFFYEMPPITEMSRFGDMEHEEFTATLVTPDGKKTSPKKFKRLQNAVRTLSGIKRGSPSEILSKLFSGDYVASTATVRAGNEWRVLIFPMKDPKAAVSSFSDEDGEPVSVADYESSVLRPTESNVDELVIENPFSDDPIDDQGNTEWECLTDLNRKYDPQTDTYYNCRPLCTLLAYEAGISTDFSNQGLEGSVRAEIEALGKDYMFRSLGTHLIKLGDSTTKWVKRYAYESLGFSTRDEFKQALQAELA